MIQLPANSTTAALALLLGLLLGAGSYHLLSPAPEQVGLEQRTQILELDRFLQPADTSSQSQPDREIRYKVKRDTVVDSVRVPVPSGLSSPSVVDEQPLQVTAGRVELTRWDPQDRRWEQDIFAVPDPVFSSRVYGLVRIRNPPQLGLPRPRVGVGLGAEVRYRSLRARLESTLSPRLQPEVEAALIWDF